MSRTLSMRDRVESGQGMLFVSGLCAVVAWWWHGLTSAPSLWWSVSLVLTVGALIGSGRGVQLVLSGFSGFGRNFHEEREPPEESSADDVTGRNAAVDRETVGAAALPTVWLIAGSVVLLLKVFPAMNFIPEFEGDHWVSPRLLVPLMFGFGFALIGWSVLLLGMMKTGPDRWTYVPGTREEIRKWTKVFIVSGVILIAVAIAYTMNV